MTSRPREGHVHRRRREAARQVPRRRRRRANPGSRQRLANSFGGDGTDRQETVPGARQGSTPTCYWPAAEHRPVVLHPGGGIGEEGQELPTIFTSSQDGCGTLFDPSVQRVADGVAVGGERIRAALQLHDQIVARIGEPLRLQRRTGHCSCQATVAGSDDASKLEFEVGAARDESAEECWPQGPGSRHSASIRPAALSWQARLALAAA